MDNFTTYKVKKSFFIDWRLTIVVLLSIFCFTGLSAQTPQYVFTNGNVNNSIPLGGGNWSDQRNQWLYPPGDFGLVPGGMAINKIYVRTGSTYPLSTYSNFQVSLGQNSTTTSLGAAWETGLTIVKQAASFSLGPTVANQWLEIELDVPFQYNPNQVLIVETIQTATSGGIALLSDGRTNNTAYTGNTQSYGSSSAAAPSAARVYSYQFGFDLISLSPNNAGIKKINSPTVFCSGTQDVIVTVNNGGINQIDSVDVFWEIDGIPMGSTRIIGLLDTMNGQYSPDTVVRLGSYSFIDPAGYDLKVWTSMPNGVLDTINDNDTITSRVAPALIGYYTIDSSQPTGRSNYNSIREFTEDLNAFGVCGPVIAEILRNSGPYNEVMEINTIPGASATNTVKIIGNGNTVQFANTATDPQLLVLSGAKYVTIDDISFKALSPTYGWGAIITNGASHDTIINCDFDLTSITGTSSANSNGICFSGSRTSPTALGNNGSNCYVANNHIKATTGSGGPYYALTLTGDSDSNQIVNNTFENFYIYGGYLNGTKGNEIVNNTFNRATKATTTTFYGIYTTGITPGTKIIGNRIHDPYGGTATATATTYGMYLLGDGTIDQPIIIANNAIYNINQGGTLYGISLSTAPYTKLYHNTIVFDKNLNSTSVNYGIYATGTQAGVDIANNIVSITAGGTGNKYGFYYNSANSINSAEKNNIYVNSTQAGNQFYGYFVADYSTYSLFSAAHPNFEANSPHIDPRFTNANAGNLLPKHPLLVGSGISLLQVVGVDIENTPRFLSPTIGAYEKAPTAMNDASIKSFAYPSGRYCDGLQDVKVVVSNMGINDIDSVEIYWEVNGMGQAPYKYIGTLSPMTNLSGINSDTVTIGSTYFSNINPITITAWTEMPNGAIDTVPINDSISANFIADAFTIAATNDTICIGGEPKLSLTPNNGYNEGDISWQRSTNGTTWQDIMDSDVITFVDSAISNITWYRANIGGSNGCYTDSIMIQVEDPILASTTPGLRQCGPGSVTLSAAATSGTIQWFEDPVGGRPLFVGDTFHTPHLQQTKTYYASAGAPGVPASGFTDSVYVTVPPTAYYGRDDLMFTLHAKNEITIQSLGIYVFNDVGDPTDWDLYYRPDDYTRVPGANTSSTGWTKVSSLRGSTSAGLGGYTHVAKSLGLVIPAGDVVSFYIAPIAGTIPIFLLDNLGTRVDSTDDAVIIAGHSGTGLFNATIASGIPLMSVRYGFGCESPRMGVDAVINSNLVPNVDLGGNRTVCYDSTVTLDAGNAGSTFLWSTGETTQTIQADTAGFYKVTVTNSSNCTASDSITITHTLGASVDSIKFNPGMNNDYMFSAAGDKNVDNYFWDFGDNNTSTSPSPIHSYTTPGIYDVTLIVTNNCGTDTVTTKVYHKTTGIDKNTSTTNVLEIYPNPAKEMVFIKHTDNQMIESITIYNSIGQNVYEVAVGNKSTYQLDVNKFAAGIYTIKIRLDDGNIIGNKLEVTK